MSATFRAAGEQDLDAVAAMESGEPMSPGWTRDQFASELGSSSSRFLIAEEDGAVSGYAVLWLVSGEAQLMTMAVASERRGRGSGRRLLSEVFAEARAGGCGRLTLEVGERNGAALGLYRSAGFRVVGRRANYYNDGTDAILMDVRLL